MTEINYKKELTEIAGAIQSLADAVRMLGLGDASQPPNARIGAIEGYTMKMGDSVDLLTSGISNAIENAGAEIAAALKKERKVDEPI